MEKVAAEPLVGLRRKDNPSYYHTLNRLFGVVGVKPRVEVECDTFNSLLAAVESGRGIALSTTVFKQVTGKWLVCQPVTGTNEVLSVGIARAKNGDITPAGEKFCEIMRKVAKGTGKTATVS